MICAYCGEEKKGTREHIIPNSIIKLFPECELAYDVTRGKTYRGDAVISDVCAECNNIDLGSLDNYGKTIVETYFLKEYCSRVEQKIEYDYELLARWLLKIAYNSARTDKDDVSWFKNNIEYLSGKTKGSLLKMSLFGGLWSNLSPVPAIATANLKVQIASRPRILSGGPIDYKTGRLKEHLEDDILDFPKVQSKYLFRIGAAMFLMLLWNKDADNKMVDATERHIGKMYPYALLNPKESNVLLETCTDAFNCHNIYLIHSLEGMAISKAVLEVMVKGRNLDVMRKEFPRCLVPN